MVLFIDLDGVLGELRYKDKISLTQKEWDECDDICSWKFKEPTTIVSYFNRMLKNVKVYILTNLPKTKIDKKHIKCKKDWCKRNLKFNYIDVIVNKEGFSKFQRARQIVKDETLILVDDSIGNLIDWESNGGIGFHISSLLTKTGRKLLEGKIK